MVYVWHNRYLAAIPYHFLLLVSYLAKQLLATHSTGNTGWYLLPNHTGSMPHNITPLDINALRGGHMRTNIRNEDDFQVGFKSARLNMWYKCYYSVVINVHSVMLYSDSVHSVIMQCTVSSYSDNVHSVTMQCTVSSYSDNVCTQCHYTASQTKSVEAFKKEYSQQPWIRVHLAFDIIRVTNPCFHASCVH